jgi:hypothetical protein
MILKPAFQHDCLWYLLKMMAHCFYFRCDICVELCYLLVQVTKHFCKVLKTRESGSAL